MASLSSDQALWVWDIATCSRLQWPLEGHPGRTNVSAIFIDNHPETVRVVGRWVELNRGRLLWLPSDRQAYNLSHVGTSWRLGLIPAS